jgi:hypothetical protein
MKILKILALSSLLLIVNGCNAQTDKGDEAISMLINFYTAHANIWSIPPSEISPADFDKKLDSLAGKYCTSKLRTEVRKYLEDGHDLLTDDRGMSKESLNSLSVVKEAKENTYVVSYIVDSFPVAPDKPVKKKVVLQVTVVMEGVNYKIASVN